MAEQKQQDVINAALDPDSNLTPENVEEKLVEESKKAGTVAYQFDPDASVEKKSEQVASVSCSNPSFHKYGPLFLVNCRCIPKIWWCLADGIRFVTT